MDVQGLRLVLVRERGHPLRVLAAVEMHSRARRWQGRWRRPKQPRRHLKQQEREMHGEVLPASATFPGPQVWGRLGPQLIQTTRARCVVPGKR